MKKFHTPVAMIAAAIGGSILLASPAAALRDDVKSVIAALDKLKADEAKVAEYCDLVADVEDAVDTGNEQTIVAAEDNLDAFLDDQQVPAVTEELPPESEDAQALDKAYAQLDTECDADDEAAEDETPAEAAPEEETSTQ